MTYLLCCEATARIVMSEEERLRALQHICAALPRTAQVLHEEVRQLCSATADGPAASSFIVTPVFSAWLCSLHEQVHHHQGQHLANKRAALARLLLHVPCTLLTPVTAACKRGGTQRACNLC